MLVEIETPEEWTARHGEPVRFKDRLLFPDGAQCDETCRQRWEPPADEHQRLLNQKTYYAELLRRAERDFETARSALVEQAQNAIKYRNLPAPTDDDVEALEEMRDTAKELFAKISDIEHQLITTRQSLKEAEDAEWERNRQNQVREVLNKLAAVSLPALSEQPEPTPKKPSRGILRLPPGSFH